MCKDEKCATIKQTAAQIEQEIVDAVIQDAPIALGIMEELLREYEANKDSTASDETNFFRAMETVFVQRLCAKADKN